MARELWHWQRARDVWEEDQGKRSFSVSVRETAAMKPTDDDLIKAIVRWRGATYGRYHPVHVFWMNHLKCFFIFPTELTFKHPLLSTVQFSESITVGMQNLGSDFCTVHCALPTTHAACLHTYIPRPTAMLSELSLCIHRGLWKGVKKICVYVPIKWALLSERLSGRTRIQVQHNWKGKGLSIFSEHGSISSWSNMVNMVYQFKVDELAGVCHDNIRRRRLVTAIGM